MNKVPQIVPVSEPRRKYVEILGLLGHGPIVLTQDDRPVAVLVSIGEWDKFVSSLEHLRDVVDVLEAKIENAGAEPEPIDLAELQGIVAGSTDN
jgi:prevent-host-death family protein